MGILFLRIYSTGIITFSELNWIVNQQLIFSRLEESTSIKLGRMIDSGKINFGCRLPA